MKQSKMASFDPQLSNSCLGVGAVASQPSSMLTAAPATQKTRDARENCLASLMPQSNDAHHWRRANDLR